MNKPVALTIAGSDPTGGAGLQADLKTFAAHNVYGASVVSALTAQNTQRFEAFPVADHFIRAQINAVFEAFHVQAIKIGMLANKQTVAAVIDALQRHDRAGKIPVVLDPVIKASNGGTALDDEGLGLLRQQLLPLCTLIKPNIAEAAILLGEAEALSVEQMVEQATRLSKRHNVSVLLSGGHLAGPEAVDILHIEGKNHTFSAKKLETRAFHGTGCTLTSSIAANLAKGHSVIDAVELAKNWLARLLSEQGQLDRTGAVVSLDHLSSMLDTLDRKV